MRVGSEEGFWRRFPPLVLLAVVLIAFVGGAISGGAVSLVLDNGDSGGASKQETAARALGAAQNDAAASTVQRVLPSVVTIVNEQPDHLDEQGNTIGTVAVGSGFIIDNRGYIVTNEHVIHDVGKLTVVLSNGDERPAELVSHDAPFTDLAVIKIPPGNLRALRWGDSSKLSLGQPVIAIGTALFEFRNSVTVGVVSGLQRRWLREGVYMEDLIQTDALLNSGNSGGPLVTLDGEVIGINSTVVRSVNGVETVTGISFALSSRSVQPIVQGIIDQGAYARPYFGIDHQNIDQEFLLTSTLQVDHGALVQRVSGDSPAAKAGIQAGDVVLRIGRFDVTDDQPFINVLSHVGINDRVDVQVWRDGHVFNTQVQVVPR
jgi:2-alkenal reductase